MSENKFHKATYDDWHSAAEVALRGKSVDSLSKTTADDIKVKPLYVGSVDNNQAALPSGAWQIVQAINHPNVQQAKQHIAEDLEQGVNALSLYSDQSLNAQGYGLNLKQGNLDNLFKNTYLDMISLRLETGLDEISAAESLQNHYKNIKIQAHPTQSSPSTPQKDPISQSTGAQLSLGIDPIGKLAQFGGWNDEVKTERSVQIALDNFSATHILRVDGRIAHNAGASEAQELGFALASALTYLKWADAANIDLNFAAQKIEICLSADQTQFMSIAKIRAMRNLWAELLDGLGLTQSPSYIYVETSFRMVTKSDPWVNILRATTACFSAGIGGADQVGILPLSAAIGLAPSFDRRLARHIQTILIEESHLADVIDPSAGSAYIETLTKELTIKAWQTFQNTQRSGGIIANLLAGNIQRQIAMVAAQRQQKYATGENNLIGTSVFKNPDEPDYQTLNVSKTNVEIPRFKVSIEPLTARRDAEMFEQKMGDA